LQGEQLNFKFKQNEKNFLGKWVLANAIAWVLGIILAIVLSYAVVNLFYPKETNLIVGLILGGTVGFSQWFIIKKHFKISTWWFWASAIGIGIPFIAEVILMEFGVIESGLIGYELLDQAIQIFIGGLLTGLFQFSILKSHSKKGIWWIVISTFGWGVSWFGFPLGGVILGIITGFAILNLLEFPVKGEVIIEK
jgi:hypothetical protein